MFDMSEMGLGPDDDDGEDGWRQLLQDIGPEIESALRKIGIYVTDIGLAPHPQQRHAQEQLDPVFVINTTIGDVAFSDRVQNPVEGRMEVEFKKIENQMSRQQFEDLQERMRKAIEEGKDPFATETKDEPGDDEESDRP